MPEENMKARKRPIVVDVRGPIAEAESVQTAHGPVPAEVGDYVITDPETGDMWPIKPDLFASTYEEVGDGEDVIRVEKTSNPVFSEDKTLHGNMPTMPKTDSMFDRAEPKRAAIKPSNDDMINGQRNTGKQSKFKPGVTQPGTTFMDGIRDMHIYFDRPGDYQTG